MKLSTKLKKLAYDLKLKDFFEAVTDLPEDARELYNQIGGLTHNESPAEQALAQIKLLEQAIDKLGNFAEFLETDFGERYARYAHLLKVLRHIIFEIYTKIFEIINKPGQPAQDFSYKQKSLEKEFNDLMTFMQNFPTNQELILKLNLDSEGRLVVKNNFVFNDIINTFRLPYGSQFENYYDCGQLLRYGFTEEEINNLIKNPRYSVQKTIRSDFPILELHKEIKRIALCYDPNEVVSGENEDQKTLVAILQHLGYVSRPSLQGNIFRGTNNKYPDGIEINFRKGEIRVFPPVVPNPWNEELLKDAVNRLYAIKRIVSKERLSQTDFQKIRTLAEKPIHFFGEEIRRDIDLLERNETDPEIRESFERCVNNGIDRLKTSIKVKITS